jgi:hypothetical protein
MSLNEECPKTRKELKKMWDEQSHLIAQQTKQPKKNMKELMLRSPRAKCKSEHQRERLLQNPKRDSKFDSEFHGTHAMVVIGSISTVGLRMGKRKRLYVLCNWWPSMPLIVVSFEYLLACRCEIYFANSKLDKDMLHDARQTEPLLACDCSFPDHSENSTYEGVNWSSDVIDGE